MANVAVAWLKKDDWKTWQDLDDQVPPYDQWLSKINSAMKDAERAGAKTEKIEIEPEIFVAWCKAKGVKVGRDSQSAYAAEVLMKRLSAH